MVRANQPARVIARLSSALAVSLGTAAYAMSSASIWMLSHGMAWPRLALLGAASIITLCVVLVLAHGLWERASGPDDRQAVVLFNLTTSATLGLAVLTLYASLLALSVVGGAGLIPPSVYQGSVGHTPAVAHYLKLGWLAAAIATAAPAPRPPIPSDQAPQQEPGGRGGPPPRGRTRRERCRCIAPRGRGSTPAVSPAMLTTCPLDREPRHASAPEAAQRRGRHDTVETAPEALSRRRPLAL